MLIGVDMGFIFSVYEDRKYQKVYPFLDSILPTHSDFFRLQVLRVLSFPVQ